MTDVHLTGIGTYLPDDIVSGAEIAERSGIPEEVVVEKMGIQRKHVIEDEDGNQPSEMCVSAARDALADADIAPEELDLVRYHGSEYKDFVVWNAAAKVAADLGASGAYADESYALCAGTPTALREARAQLAVGDVETALLVTASREEDLVNYDDADTSFMFNFGSGAAAYVLERDAPERALATVHESAAITDGSFAEDVVMPAGGTRQPPTADTVGNDLHRLYVPDQDGMKERLAEVSLPNFLAVADEALERSGFERDDLDFAAITHMKRSFHDHLCGELGLESSEHRYLDDYGHVQSVDQWLALSDARAAGDLGGGDVVLALAAGTGYTWAATVLSWHD